MATKTALEKCFVWVCFGEGRHSLGDYTVSWKCCKQMF